MRSIQEIIGLSVRVSTARSKLTRLRLRMDCTQDCSTQARRSSRMASRSPSQTIAVSADAATSLGFFVSTTPAPAIKPRLIGMNGELSTVALPLKAGKTFTIYVAGEGFEELAATGISSSSPFIQVDASTVTSEEFDAPYPVISFEISVARETPAGDYSLVLQSTNGEFVYLVGALSIE